MGEFLKWHSWRCSVPHELDFFGREAAGLGDEVPEGAFDSKHFGGEGKAALKPGGQLVLVEFRAEDESRSSRSTR